MTGAGYKKIILLCTAVFLLSGCTLSPGRKTLADTVLTGVQKAEAAGIEEDSRRVLETLWKIPGMKDEQTAELLGGGEENWTEDGTLYIGRIYQTELFGEKCKVLTSCSNDRIVKAVTVWVVHGEREVSEEEARLWTERISDMMNADTVCRYQLLEYRSLESGARSWKWIQDDLSVSMCQMKDILSISFQPADSTWK